MVYTSLFKRCGNQELEHKEFSMFVFVLPTFLVTILWKSRSLVVFITKTNTKCLLEIMIQIYGFKSESDSLDDAFKLVVTKFNLTS